MLWRWRDDFQNDFAARMDWTTKPFAVCNHPPVPVLDHPATLTVKSGEGVWITAPIVDKPETLHFILRVTDKGTPALSRYARVIVTVTP